MSRLSKYLPLLLIIFMIASAYKLVSDKTGNMAEYKAHIKAADEYFQEGIIVDAVEEIDKAIEVNPSVDLMIKKGNYYYQSGEGNLAVKYSDTILEQYPKEAKAYDFALKAKDKYRGFQFCYDILDSANKRQIKSKVIDEYNQKLKYKTYTEYTDIKEVGTARSSRYIARKKELWGYYDRKGRRVIDFVFVDAGPFVEDLAPVILENGEVTFIDKNGMKKLNIPKQIGCERASVISEGMVVLYSKGKAGYYNTDFKHLFGEYDYATPMLNSVAAVKDGERWTIINSKGKKVNQNIYEDIKYNDAEFISTSERVFAKTNGKYIMLDTHGKQVGKLQFEDAECFVDKFAAVKINGKWGFVDTDGKIIIKPEYEEAHSFANDLAAVKKDGRWGYIDSNNKMVIENTFFEAGNMNGLGCAFVKSKEKDETYNMLKLYSKNH